jgi:predicted metalloprotease
VRHVLAETEDTWQQIFRQNGKQYVEPTLVLFSGATRTACGVGQAAMGPFYCPADQKVYIDLAFYQELKTRFKAPGDFAQAYVIAHEVGHHVQNLLGISEKVQAARERAGERQANALSVRLELQADCLAGVWAKNADAARGILEAGDVEEALRAASAIGDDTLQKQAQGYAVPDSFTHGSAEQRVRWFKRGMDRASWRLQHLPGAFAVAAREPGRRRMPQVSAGGLPFTASRRAASSPCWVVWMSPARSMARAGSSSISARCRAAASRPRFC